VSGSKRATLLMQQTSEWRVEALEVHLHSKLRPVMSDERQPFGLSGMVAPRPTLLHVQARQSEGETWSPALESGVRLAFGAILRFHVPRLSQFVV